MAGYRGNLLLLIYYFMLLHITVLFYFLNAWTSHSTCRVRRQITANDSWVLHVLLHITHKLFSLIPSTPAYLALMAGYRDILLNISIENEHTKLLGTNHHICEVQLTLDDFHVSFFFCGGRGLRVIV